MYSLQKYYEGEGEEPLTGYSDKVTTFKLDGAAISLLYVEGHLVQVSTRGDGIEGQDITNKFLHTNLVPKFINLFGVVQVTGEIVAPSSIENARNYAAGSLNLKSLEEFKTRQVNFYAYGVQPSVTETYREDMFVLYEQGFATLFSHCPELDCPTDGQVVRLNSNKLFDELGYTSKYPRGAYAIKTRSSGVETTLLDVVWQVGKTGRVTPVAILEPVMVGDAMVSRATLNNPGFIKALGLNIGDRVSVIRAGEIIPCITHKVED
jgi:DNA ligase (NAD+)